MFVKGGIQSNTAKVSMCLFQANIALFQFRAIQNPHERAAGDPAPARVTRPPLEVRSGAAVFANQRIDVLLTRK
eukprot:614571-Pyramimonas_sp.AAC.1